MRNILDEKPSDPLIGRLAFSVDWVSNDDVAGKDILDIGCGYGWFEYHLLSRAPATMTGIEQSENDLATVKKHISDPRAHFLPGSAIDLPFENETFDTVVSWEVLEHIPKGTEPRMFQEVSRVLRPGGVFYLSTPFNNLLCNVTDPAWLIAGHRHYTESKLRELGASQNFAIEDVFAVAGPWTILASLDMYFSKWVLRRRPTLKRWTDGRQTAEYRQRGFVSAFAKYRKKQRPEVSL